MRELLLPRRKKKARKKNKSAPGSDCTTCAGVIHHAKTHSATTVIPGSGGEKVGGRRGKLTGRRQGRDARRSIHTPV